MTDTSAAIILLDPARNICCVVEGRDYAWAMQWRWHVIFDRHGRKMYAARNTRRGRRKQIKIYMHKAVLERAGAVQPSPAHHIGEHGDGNSLNNRRDNLEYFTASQNRRTAR